MHEIGDRNAYETDATPFGTGAYGDVFRALHKTTGEWIALKRLRSRFDGDAKLRMRREIRAMRAFGGQRHIMPVLDWSEENAWYTMPLADGDLVKLRQSLDDSGLVNVILQAGAGLASAHAAGWVHRDVKPQNILRLSSNPDSWVVADWGLVRGPRGFTTHQLTQTRQALGTEGFMAPEVLDGAHEVAAAADVFSLARVLTWAVTGRWPLAGDREPPPGMFRRIIRDATHDDPVRRLPLNDLLEGIRKVPLGPQPASMDSPVELLRRANVGDAHAAEELLLAASDRPSDADLHLDFVVQLSRDQVRVLAGREPRLLLRVAQAVHRHLEDSFGHRDFDYLNTILGWTLNVSDAAQTNGQMGLLEDASELLFAADPRWDRWRNRQRVQRWLNELRGEAASTVARALARAPEAVEFYRDGGWQPQGSADPAVRRLF